MIFNNFIKINLFEKYYLIYKNIMIILNIYKIL